MTSTGLLRLGTRRVHFTLGPPRVAPGVATHRLIIPIAVTGEQDESETAWPAIAMCSVWTEMPGLTWLGACVPQILNIRSFPVPEELALDVAPEQFIALERLRAHDDVALRLKLQMSSLGVGPSEFTTTQEDVSYRVVASTWTGLLESAGLDIGVAIRIRSPLTDDFTLLKSEDGEASLARATARLREAKAQLRSLQFEACIGTCRRILELLGQLVEIPPEAGVRKLNPSERGPAERWAAIYYDVRSLASVAHHDDDNAAQFSWARSDAEAGLAMTASLLLHYCPPSR